MSRRPRDESSASTAKPLRRLASHIDRMVSERLRLRRGGEEGVGVARSSDALEIAGKDARVRVVVAERALLDLARLEQERLGYALYQGFTQLNLSLIHI